MLRVYFLFWFRPHRFFDTLALAAKRNDDIKTQAYCVDSLWFGTFIILVVSSYPAAVLAKNTFGKYSFLNYFIGYFIAAALVSIIFALLTYYVDKGSSSITRGPGRIISLYSTLFGHAIVIANLTLVFLPLCFIASLLELLFHSEFVEAVTIPIMVAILRTLVHFFVAQAMHENFQQKKVR